MEEDEFFGLEPDPFEQDRMLYPVEEPVDSWPYEGDLG